jgi:hypothetical protein
MSSNDDTWGRYPPTPVLTAGSVGRLQSHEIQRDRTSGPIRRVAQDSAAHQDTGRSPRYGSTSLRQAVDDVRFLGTIGN